MLVGALVGPYFINWTAYRSTFEREASRYFGRTVTVVGKADLRLLPTPAITFTDVRIGNPDEPDIIVERFHTMVELSPLMKGEINVLEMRVDRPTMHIDLAKIFPGQPGTVEPPEFDLEKISLSQVEISQGEATIVDSRTGDEWILSGINAVVEARSLLGPASLDGGLVFNGERFDIRAAAGRRVRGSVLPLNVSVTPANWPLAMSSEGELVLEPGAPPRYRAAVVIGARDENPADAATDPYGLGSVRIVGSAELTPESLVSEEFLIVYGPQDRPLQLNGSGSIEYGTARKFDVDLIATQIELDRILGGGPAEPVAISEAMAAISAAVRRLPHPDMPGAVTLSADGLVVGGSVVQNIQAELAPDADGGWSVQRFDADLPGETRVEARGRLVGGAVPGFEGWGRIASQRPAALSAWWRNDPGNTSRLGPFTAEANIAISAASRVADNIIARTGEGTVRGMVAARNFAASNDMFVTIELESDRFDLDRARALVEVFGGDLLAAGDVNRVSIDLRADVLVAGGIEARAVTIEGDYEDLELDLRRMTIADLAGARVEARGRLRDILDQPSGRFDATLKADSLSGTALFLAGLFPGSSFVEYFGRVAPALAPVDAELSIQAGEPDIDLAVDIGGNFAGTRISLAGVGTGRLSEPESLSGTINGLFVGTDTSKVLAQIGLPVLPLPDLGPARLTLELDGSLSEGAALRLQAEAAGTGVEFAGEAGLALGAPLLEGRLDIVSSNIDPILLMSGVSLPGVGEGHSMMLQGDFRMRGAEADIDITSAGYDREPVKGDLRLTFGDPLRVEGTLELQQFSMPLALAAATGLKPEHQAQGWPDLPFSGALPDGLALDMAFRALDLDIGFGPMATNGRFTFNYAEGRTEIDEFNADFAGGQLAGTLTTSNNSGLLELEVRANLERAALDKVVWRPDGLPIATGALTGSINLSGNGRSLSGLVSTLTGDGAVSVSNATVRKINPEAFQSIIEISDQNAELTDEEIALLFEGYLADGTLEVYRASGSIGVAQGIMQFSTLSVESGPATLLGDAAINLNELSIETDWSMKIDVAAEDEVTGTDPEIRLSFSGPLGQPVRRVDADPLVGFLTVRAFERDVERIEALQREIEERERQLGLRPAGNDAGGIGGPGLIPPDSEALGEGEAEPEPEDGARLQSGDAESAGTAESDSVAVSVAPAVEESAPRQEQVQGTALPALEPVQRESLTRPATPRARASALPRSGQPIELLPGTGQ